MMVDPSAYDMLMIIGASIFVFFMFLPAIFELKNPKDPGPRKIVHEPASCASVRLHSVDGETDRNQTLAKKVSEIIAFLPNLET